MKTLKKTIFTDFALGLIFVVACIGITFFVYYTGGTSTAWAQLNYIPIFAAAYLWGQKGSLIISFLLGLMVGPFMPLDRFHNISQTPENWLIRMILYLGIAWVVGYIFSKNNKYQKIIKDNFSKGQFDGFYNTNKLIIDLNKLMDENDSFDIIFINISNLEDISKYVKYSITTDIAKDCLNKLESYFSNVQKYSITTAEYIFIIKNEAPELIDLKLFNYVQSFNNSVKIDEYLFKLIIKIGFVKYNGVKTNAIELFNKARIAADQGEPTKSGSYNYDNDFEEEQKLYNDISGSLNSAIANKEMYTVFQPIIDINENKITNAEILIRWNRSDKKPIGPNIFIPIAEETGSIKVLTKWIIISTIKHYLIFKEKGLNLTYSINVSANELLDEDFIQWALKYFNIKNLNLNDFGIEITERVLSKDNTKLNNVLKYLKNQGFDIEIDDFGTGYNSLMTIGEIPFNIIKIDKYFIDRIFDNGIKTIIEHIINAIHEIGGQVIAEGVETKEQYLILRHLKCDKIQGYYFSKPLLAEDFYDYCSSFDIKKYE
ncbi:MAG: EAL domain-containing protein [Sphaerochaetaceae bacterium]|nr:EAL domain-containing protein [Sphaerochaetaceae bacterium]